MLQRDDQSGLFHVSGVSHRSHGARQQSQWCRLRTLPMRRHLAQLTLVLAPILAPILATALTVSTNPLLAYEEATAVTTLPPIWQDASGHQIVAGVKAAEAIARRNFAARLKGMRIDGTTTVADIVQSSNSLHAQVDQLIAGVKMSEPRFRDDGRVQVTASGIVRDVLTSIERDIEERRQFWSGKIHREEFLKMTEDIRDETITVIGESALPGTLGEKRLRWLLLARLDAMSKLLARIEGIQINASTKIGDYLLQKDSIRSRLGALLTGATIEKVDFSHPKYVTVEMSLKMEEIIETVTYNADDQQQRTAIDQQLRELTFTETGMGSEDSDQAPLAAPSAEALSLFSQQADLANVVIERRISRRPVSH
jgi:hypothetical protein